MDIKYNNGIKFMLVEYRNISTDKIKTERQD